ncbi:hypothetical protein OMP38_27870 [Cohnella ginsengisoli]|uniref:Uncharacterized protein n=1 Tax=Cohnella ginsengisoli TaxID=425004 RepID=A0A9X4KLF7_9BACL|nr:hypothetical protein [Cohnella ginsengisoli]MDG0794228.1 hypothetical protein [Cohnella ginsengisoli]
MTASSEAAFSATASANFLPVVSLSRVLARMSGNIMQNMTNSPYGKP